MAVINFDNVYGFLISFSALAALIIGLYNLGVQKRQLKVLKWNQIKKTFDLIEIWSGEHMTKVRLKAREYCSYEELEPVNMKRLLQLENYKEIAQYFTTILNYLEAVSLAYLKNVVDKDITYTYFVYTLVNYYLLFEPFIIHLRKKLEVSEKPLQLELKSFGCIEIVAKRWIGWSQEKPVGVGYRALEKKPVHKEQ